MYSLVVGAFGHALLDGFDFGIDGAALGDDAEPAGECSVEVLVKNVATKLLVFDDFGFVGLDGTEPSIDVAFG